MEVDDPVAFLKENPPPVILDEIQYTPELLHYIKSAIDEDRKAGQWLLSGSQNFALMPGHTEGLKKWRDIAGDLASPGLLIADIEDSFEMRGSRAVSWRDLLDML